MEEELEQPLLAQDPGQVPPGAELDADIEVSIENNLTASTNSNLSSRPADASRPIKAVYDDFSLTSGSASGVRFRSHNRTREFKIYDQPNAQLILEEVDDLDATEDGDGKQGGRGRGIRIKQAHDTSYGLQFLRGTYSLIAVFVAGFLLILGICILLFLFIDLAVQLGLSSNQDISVSNFIFVALSIPIFVYSLAMGMTLITRFVVDTFYGHPFLRTFGLDLVTTDWIAFVMYLGIPVVTIICSLYAQNENWWEVSCLTWFSSILIFFGFFAACALWFEIKECLDLIVEVEEDLTEDSHWFLKMKRAVIHGMKSRLSGTRLTYHKLVFHDEDDDKAFENVLDGKNRHPEGFLTLLSRTKLLSCIYTELEEPKRIYSLDETRGSVSFVTRTSWSLEKLFCRKGGVLGAVPITSGDYSITRSQINSTIACRLLGLFLYILMLGGAAHWFGLRGAELGILLFVLFLIVILANITTFKMLDVRRDVINQSKIFRFWVKHQVTVPSTTFTLVFTALEIILFYILPLGYFFTDGNTATGSIFLFFGFLSGLRHYMNAQKLLEEIGPVHFDQQHRHSDSADWKKKHRFYQIAEIGADSARWFWIYTFLGFILFFIMVVLLAVYDTSTGNVNDENYGNSLDMYTLMSDFRYSPQPNLPYPTCALKKGITSVNFDEVGLSSYAFLAGLAYTYENQTQTYLDEWYGEIEVKNDIETVDTFQNAMKEAGEKFSDSAVSYRLFTFSGTEAILSIRGTSTVWDLMADAQLWLPATLFQVLRFFLPVGSVFTPILHHTAKFVSSLETTSIEKVAFYKETARFVEYLKERGYTVVVTGHSLGGGLALITGSQTDTPAIGMSAPNAMISRDTFYPPVTVEQLNTLTFNVVPQKDIIPMADDKARLFENINCTAPNSGFADCHSIVRTLCEIQFSCGSNDRPVPCECVFEYKYPEPTYVGNGTESNFTQACLDAGFSK